MADSTEKRDEEEEEEEEEELDETVSAVSHTMSLSNASQELYRTERCRSIRYRC
jgi:hypothetical protein